MDRRDDTPERLEELCRRLTTSDRVAFETVFRLFRDDVVRYVRSVVKREAVAHDLTQDVFVALWERRGTLDPKLSLKAFVYRMARNAAYRHMRDTRTHERKHMLLELEENGLNTNGAVRDGAVDADMLADKIRGWIGELPERQREALVLSRYHDLSHREIASVMGISPRTVNNHIVRALGNLHDRIQAFEPALLKS